MDALIQSAVCEDIGWREGTRKMIVYASDAGFHSQGNGFLRNPLIFDKKLFIELIRLEKILKNDKQVMDSLTDYC